MSDSVSDPFASARGEPSPRYPVLQPATPSTATESPVPPAPDPPHSPPPDGPGPRYTAPYPPYPYDPPQSGGLPENIAAGLAYFTILPAVFFLLMEPYRNNVLVRFHSWQSIFLFITIAVMRAVEMMLVAMLPSAVAFSIGSLFSLLFFIAWLVAVIKAFQGSKFHLPLVGQFAETTAASSSVRS
jgi:uncharacterized membrane protein